MKQKDNDALVNKQIEATVKEWLYLERIDHLAIVGKRYLCKFATLHMIFFQSNYRVGLEFQESQPRTGRATVDIPWQIPGESVTEQAGIILLAFR